MSNHNNNENHKLNSKSDEEILNSLQSIEKPDVTLQSSHKVHWTVIGLIFFYIIFSIPFFICKLDFSNLPLVWAIITPYAIYLINYYRQKDKRFADFSHFIQEIQESLYRIHILRELDNKSQITEQFDLLRKFENKLEKINCYFIEKDNETILLIYTHEAKYEVTKDNIVQVDSPEKGVKSIINQENPIDFINLIIEELKDNV